ncbi:hypothetical protein [Parafrankia sp. EUN1f]|uniref:hypothetical protein n=1 Tax=Parafrankia sp. EUN1f TaxID=102897 RepID=UPI0012FBDCED|nr:hypothetical protein [Parafrankia sp. EUN1f]
MSLLSSILLTALGGILTAFGGYIGVRYQAKEAARARRETQQREDLFRLHAERREAYVAFYQAVGGCRRAFALMAQPGWDRPSAREVRSNLWASWIVLRLIGKEGVLEAASNFLSYVDGMLDGSISFSNEDWRDLVNGYVENARDDLLMGNTI